MPLPLPLLLPLLLHHRLLLLLRNRQIRWQPLRRRLSSRPDIPTRSGNSSRLVLHRHRHHGHGPRRGIIHHRRGRGKRPLGPRDGPQALVFPDGEDEEQDEQDKGTDELEEGLDDVDDDVLGVEVGVGVVAGGSAAAEEIMDIDGHGDDEAEEEEEGGG